jgi:hypothetical protein
VIDTKTTASCKPNRRQTTLIKCNSRPPIIREIGRHLLNRINNIYYQFLQQRSDLILPKISIHNTQPIAWFELLRDSAKNIVLSTHPPTPNYLRQPTTFLYSKSRLATVVRPPISRHRIFLDLNASVCRSTPTIFNQTVLHCAC